MNEPQTPKTSALAIWSMVLGILSFFCLSLFGSVPAIICGHMARKQMRASGENLSGGGFAITGLITGYLNVAVHLAVFAAIFTVSFQTPVREVRTDSYEAACRNNLMMLKLATDHWALEHSAAPGTELDFDQLRPHTHSNAQFSCPSGGMYSLHGVGKAPTCSFEGHTLEPRPDEGF